MTDQPEAPVHRIGQGNVTIALEGEEIVLKPSIIAAQTLSRKYGGLQGTISALARIDIDAIVDTIELGMGRRTSNPREKAAFAEKVFRAGLSDDTGRLAEFCINYVGILMRGGRPPSTDDDAGGTEGN